jgi:hypothetical protein
MINKIKIKEKIKNKIMHKNKNPQIINLKINKTFLKIINKNLQI